MKSANKPQKAFIASYLISDMDPFLRRHGFLQGMILFAIPDLGVLFRCRATGNRVDMEFAALFSMLRFLKTRLKSPKVKEVKVLSSDPEFLFAFSGKSKHLRKGSERLRLLQEYSKKLKIEVGYIKISKNKALISTADYPSAPADSSIKLFHDKSEPVRTTFKPFQKGINI